MDRRSNPKSAKVKPKIVPRCIDLPGGVFVCKIHKGQVNVGLCPAVMRKIDEVKLGLSDAMKNILRLRGGARDGQLV